MTDASLAGGRPPASLTEAGRTAALDQISWGAVFAGVVIALTVQFAVNLLGVSLGAATIEPGGTGNPDAGAFSIAGGVWYLVAGLIGAFVGGFVSSRLSGRPVKSVGGFHGLTTWAVSMLVVLYLLTTSVGALLGGAFGGLTSAIGGVGGAASTAIQTAAPSVAQMNPLQQIEQQVRRAGEGQDPEALRAGAVAAVNAVLTGDPAQAEEARSRAAEAIARAQNVSVEQARTQVGEYEQRYRAIVEEAKRQSTAAAKTATKVVSGGALLGFVALLLGAIAAWFGGVAGTVRPGSRA